MNRIAFRITLSGKSALSRSTNGSSSSSKIFSLSRTFARGPGEAIDHSGITTTATSSVFQETSSTQLRAPIVDRPLTDLENINLNLTPPREAWVDNFDSIESREKRGLVSLHPRIFSAFPRIDAIYENVRWQKRIHKVQWFEMPHRVELDRMGPRPWPQKGTGRARHSDKRSPIWHCGGWNHPPRGPRTFYFQLEHQTRLLGLISTFSVKFAQNDIKIVDTLEDFPSDDPKDLEALLDNRMWGPSALIVDSNPVFPRNITLASEGIAHVNLMPVFGLNVYSMLKHETLILTLSALEAIEAKLNNHSLRLDTDKFDRQIKLRDLDYERDPMTELPLDD